MTDANDLELIEIPESGREYMREVLEAANSLPAMLANRIVSGEGSIFGFVPRDLSEDRRLNFHWSLSSNRESQSMSGYGGGRERLIEVFANLLTANSNRGSLYSDVHPATERRLEAGEVDPGEECYVRFDDELYLYVRPVVSEDSTTLKSKITSGVLTGQLWHSMFLITEAGPQCSGDEAVTSIDTGLLEDWTARAVVVVVEAWDGDEFLYWVPDSHRAEVVGKLSKISFD